MDVFVVDGGARGHALASKMAESPHGDGLWVCPGNPGTEEIAESTGPLDMAGQLNFAQGLSDSFTVVGQEDPLAAGIVDGFRQANLRIFGPTKAAAEIESSRSLAKEIAKLKGIPIARSQMFGTDAEVLGSAKYEDFPLVIKPDGLAQGSGTRICYNEADVAEALRYLRGRNLFGEPGQYVHAEEFLEGPEISLHAWCDGETYRMFPFAMQDHKTIYDGDKGPMTGGMGVIVPVSGITAQDIERLGHQFVAPVLEAMKEKGRPFQGIIYPGLKLTLKGPKLLEYNARPGGPETEAWIPLLESDLLEIMLACEQGKLAELKEIRWRKAATACIVLAAKGYPDPNKTEKGAVITGLGGLADRENIIIFHGGTRHEGNMIVTDRGRVISLVAVGEEGEPLKNVLKRGYAAAAQIHFGGERPQMRRDIGKNIIRAAFRNRITQPDTMPN